ncbi:hypothetical protein [Methanosarcina horonobensis]|nr:hypothetical protein [Methanosarcina horonobensis]
METTQADSDVYYIEELHSIKEEVTSLRNDFSRFFYREQTSSTLTGCWQR